jgi:isoquinoline 1-oxidoreductase beta subunit
MILDHIVSRPRGPEQSRPADGLSRRTFLQAGATAGGGLMLSLHLPPAGSDAKSAEGDRFAPNAFIRIDGDGQIILTMPYVEMGQGTYTSIPMLIAEELEVDLKQVRLAHAPPNNKLYMNPLLGEQATGNSNAVRGAWQPLRQAGATARTMLVAAAAKRWNVDPASCRAHSGEVLHPPTGRRATYGELAADAAHMPVPQNVALKRPQDFKLIGTPANRLDTPSKINGSAVYGIDVRLPGMKFATLAQSPVFGGRVKAVDDTAAKAVKGARQIVRLDDAVAVVADHMGAAKKGLAALKIEWDDGPPAKLATSDVADALEKATLNPGAVAQNIGDVDKAMAGAATKVEASYHLPFLAHAPMEPMNCTVHVGNDACEIWVGNQAIARAQAAAAKAAGLPLDKVVLHNHLLGGGFGRRLEPDGIVRAIEIAKHVDGPVKVVWTREEDIQHDMYRPYWFDRLTAGLDQKGMPVAWNNRRRICAGRTSGHSDGVLAQRRAVAQCVRDRELHGRARGGGEAGCGRLSASSARQVAARQGRARSRGGEIRLGAAVARAGRPRRRAAVRLRELHGPCRRSRGSEGRAGQGPPRHLCGRLRHRRQS